MSKLERKNHKVFGINATETKVGQFGSANATTKITTKDVEKIQALDAWEQGWEAGAVGNNRYPTQQERTGVDYEHSYQIGYMLQEGVPEWNKDTTYNKGSIVKTYNGTTLQNYVSLVDDNLNNAVTDTAKWKSGLANSDLSNLTTTGEKHFLNKSQVTNCILEAPNGVATYMDDTLTVKQGLKVLIPNGRNADGTLKNIEYTLENDITKTITTTYEHQDVFFIKNDGTCFSFGAESIAFYNKLADRPAPATNVFRCCFVEATNFWYVTSNGSPYEELKMAKLGTFFYNASSSIVKLNADEPINLLKQSDKADITNWSFPSNKYKNLTLGASGTPYIAPADGYFCVTAYSNNENGFHSIELFYNQTVDYTKPFIRWEIAFPTAYGGGLAPVKKGQNVCIQYSRIDFPKSQLKFLNAVGSESLT